MGDRRGSRDFPNRHLEIMGGRALALAEPQIERGPPVRHKDQTLNRERSVEIPAGKRIVRGILSVPRGAKAVVIFAHGSGSGRFSARNQFVAGVLQDAGLATLLVDLLDEEGAPGIPGWSSISIYSRTAFSRRHHG